MVNSSVVHIDGNDKNRDGVHITSHGKSTQNNTINTYKTTSTTTMYNNTKLTAKDRNTIKPIKSDISKLRNGTQKILVLTSNDTLIVSKPFHETTRNGYNNHTTIFDRSKTFPHKHDLDNSTQSLWSNRSLVLEKRLNETSIKSEHNHSTQSEGVTNEDTNVTILNSKGVATWRPPLHYSLQLREKIVSPSTPAPSKVRNVFPTTLRMTTPDQRQTSTTKYVPVTSVISSIEVSTKTEKTLPSATPNLSSEGRSTASGKPTETVSRSTTESNNILHHVGATINTKGTSRIEHEQPIGRRSTVSTVFPPSQPLSSPTEELFTKELQLLLLGVLFSVVVVLVLFVVGDVVLCLHYNQGLLWMLRERVCRNVKACPKVPNKGKKLEEEEEKVVIHYPMAKVTYQTFK